MNTFRDKFFINFSYKKGNEEKKREKFLERYGEEILKNYRKSDPTDPIYENTPTFKEFIQFVVDQPLNRQNPHWIPIYLTCMPCHIKYSVIGRSVKPSAIKLIDEFKSLELTQCQMTARKY